MSEKLSRTSEQTQSGREKFTTMTLRREAQIVELIRILKTNLFLNVFMVRIEMNIAHEKDKILREFIASGKPKHLVFAINNHSSDIDAITVHKLLLEKYPDLMGRLVFLADQERWSQPKYRHMLDVNFGSYILINRDPKVKSDFEKTLGEIKEAMDTGYAIVFFTEGTRQEGARQGNFAVSIASSIEENLEPGSLMDGVLTVEMSLNGLRGVYPKVEPEQEMNERKKAIKKRVKHLVDPRSWHRPDAWRKAELRVEEFFFSRTDSGEKLTRGQMKNMIVEARKQRTATAESETQTE